MLAYLRAILLVLANDEFLNSSGLEQFAFSVTYRADDPDLDSGSDTVSFLLHSSPDPFRS
jgi:hypothetical protein